MSGSNSVQIKITDGVDPSIDGKIKNIGNSAKNADSAVKSLQKSISGLNSSAISQIASVAQNAVSSLNNQAIAQQKLAAATSQASTAATNNQSAQARLQTAVVNTATASQRLVTATNNASASQSRMESAADRAAIAQLRLQQAQEKAASGAESSSVSFMELYARLMLLKEAAEASKSIAELGDEYQNMINRLNNVSSSMAQSAEILKQLKTIANDTYQPIESVVNGFQRFDRALAEQGASQQESIRFTKTLNELLQTSGDTTAEATAAVIQLSQAFNAGKLQGNDFHSVATELPSVMTAIAKTLNVNVGQLKTLSTQGKITSQVMRQAFAQVASSADEISQRHMPTVEQAFVNASNNAKIFFGELYQSEGITATFANAILGLSSNFNTLAKVAVTAGATLLTYFAPSIISGITTAFAALTAVLLANPLIALTAAIVGAGVALYEFSDSIKPLGDGITTLGDIGVAVFDKLKSYASIVADFIVDKWQKVVHMFDAVDDWLRQVNGDPARTITQSQSVSNGNYTGVLGAAQQRARLRQLNEGMEPAGTLLRGAGRAVATPTTAARGHRERISYASIMQQLTDQYQNAGQPSIDNSIQAQYDKIIQQATRARLALTPTQKTTIFDTIKSAVTKQAISDLTETNNQLKDSNSLLGEYGDKLTIDSQVMQYMNSHQKDMGASTKYLVDQYRDLVKQQIEGQRYQSAMNRIWSDTTEKLKDAAAAQKAYYDASRGYTTRSVDRNGVETLTTHAPTISREAGDNGIANARVSASNARLAAGGTSSSDILTSGFGQAFGDLKTSGEQYANTFGSLFKTFDDGFSDSITKAITGTQYLSSSIKSLANDALSSLLSSMIKIGEQKLFSSLFSGLLGGLSGGGDSVFSSFGGGLSGVFSGASASGFATGGYTGDGGVNDVAGTVHGQEYVFNAAATARIGKDTLDALHNGTTLPGANSASASQSVGTSPKVTIHNYGNGVSHDVQYVSRDEIRIIARDEANQSVNRNASRVVSRDLNNPNGRMSKAVVKNTTANRKRH